MAGPGPGIAAAGSVVGFVAVEVVVAAEFEESQLRSSWTGVFRRAMREVGLGFASVMTRCSPREAVGVSMV